MMPSSLAAQLCVAYADETCGNPTSWTFADEATSLDCMVALFFAAAWQRHNVVRALVVECPREYQLSCH